MFKQNRLSREEYIVSLQEQIKKSLFIQGAQEAQLLEILPTLSDGDLYGVEQMMIAAEEKEDLMMKAAFDNEQAISDFNRFYIDTEAEILKKEEKKSLQDVEQEIQNL